VEEVIANERVNLGGVAVALRARRNTREVDSE